MKGLVCKGTGLDHYRCAGHAALDGPVILWAPISPQESISVFTYRWRSSSEPEEIWALAVRTNKLTTHFYSNPKANKPSKPKPKWNLHRHRIGLRCQHRHSGEGRNPWNTAECPFLDTGLRRCDEGFYSFRLHNLTNC